MHAVPQAVQAQYGREFNRRESLIGVVSYCAILNPGI